MLKTFKNKKKNKFNISEILYIGIVATINGFRSTLASCEGCRHRLAVIVVTTAAVVAVTDVVVVVIVTVIVNVVVVFFVAIVVDAALSSSQG